MFEAGGEAFSASGSMPLRPGFTAIMPWRASQAEPLPALLAGEVLAVAEVELYQVGGALCPAGGAQAVGRHGPSL